MMLPAACNVRRSGGWERNRVSYFLSWVHLICQLIRISSLTLSGLIQVSRLVLRCSGCSCVLQRWAHGSMWSGSSGWKRFRKLGLMKDCSMVGSLTLCRRCISSIAVHFCCNGNSPLAKNITNEVSLFLTREVILFAEPLPQSLFEEQAQVGWDNWVIALDKTSTGRMASGREQAVGSY